MAEPSYGNLPVPTDGSGRYVPSAAPPPLPGPQWDQAPQEEEGGFEWQRYVAAVLRHKWLVAGITLAGTVAGLFLSRLEEPVYQAEATILVPERVQDGRLAGPIRPDVLFQTYGWVELIKTSFIVLDNVVRDLRLYLHVESPEDSTALQTLTVKDPFRYGRYALVVSPDGRAFQLLDSEGQVLQEGQVVDSIGPDLGLAWVAPEGSLRAGRTIRFSLVPPRDVARTLQQQVQARINERGANMLAIQLEGTSPRRITSTVNAIATGFVDSARSLSLSKHRELTSTLRLQLDSADRRLRESELAFERFRVSTYTLPRERATPVAPGVDGTNNPALDNFTQMGFQLDAIERDREALEGALASLSDSGLSADRLAYIGAVQQSTELSAALRALTERQSELAALRLRYTDQNPDVQRAAGAVMELRTRTIPDLARGLLSQLVTREQEIESRRTSAGRELRQIPVRATEEQRLRRQMELATVRYQDLEQQYQAAMYAQAAEELGARVLDSAVVPTRPIRDTALRLLAMALVGSLGLGLAAAILLEHLDRRVRYPDQVSRELGLPILGAVPRVGGRNGTKGGKSAEQTLQVVESLRGIRLGLLHAHGVAGPLMATITSPGPAEGKSFVSSNLALAFAEAGHRTLLIDGDLRRGELHRVLDAQRKPGLTDYLQGTIPRDEVIQTTRFDSLWFIGGGTRLHAAPELLSSPLLSQLLLSLRSSYDVILVDSPPMGAGVDPFVLGTATGNLLLVMRTGVTDREMAEAKLDMLDRLPVRVLGAILNDVQRSGVYRYYGYDYYVDGYGTQDEITVSAREAGADATDARTGGGPAAPLPPPGSSVDG